MPSLSSVPKFIDGGSYATDISLREINSWIKQESDAGGVDMDPDFQRGHVWTEIQQTRFVEYLIRGGKGSNTIFWNHPNYERTNNNSELPDVIVLIDGKQRLNAVQRFMANELPVFGHVLNDWNDARNFTGVSGPRLRFHVNNLQSRKELLQWYLDLNSGGVVHSEDEILRVKALLAAENNREAELKGGAGPGFP
jgi:hypothetical protein